MDYLDLLTRRETLLALGACLVVVGFVLRGIARAGHRAQSLRKQHRLDNPLAGGNEADGIDRHLEQYLPLYSTAAICIGVVLSIIAFFR
jgi:hypothetical protein